MKFSAQIFRAQINCAQYNYIMAHKFLGTKVFNVIKLCRVIKHSAMCYLNVNRYICYTVELTPRSLTVLLLVLGLRNHDHSSLEFFKRSEWSGQSHMTI